MMIQTAKLSFRVFVFLVVVLSFTSRLSMAMEAEKDAVSFQIHGDGMQFRVDNRELALGDCVVTSISAHKRNWQMPDHLLTTMGWNVNRVYPDEHICGG